MKKKTFCKRYNNLQFLVLISFLGWILLIASSSHGQQKTEVMILPFGINAESDLSYLRKDLPQLLADSLRGKGFEVLSQDQTHSLLVQEQVEFLDLSTVRNLATMAGVDYAVYGSLTQAGENLSIDTRIVDPYDPEATKSLYVSKKGLINVLPAVKELSQKITDNLLKRENIAEIDVTGNKALGKDFVLMRLQIQEGDRLQPEKIDEEVRKLYQTGYFEDIKVYVEEVRQGKKITFEVVEKPIISTITVHGAEEVDKDDILETMSTKPGSVLNAQVIQEDLNKIRDLYSKKGYYRAEVSYNQKVVDTNKAELVLNIDEGKKLYIEHITIQGAQKIDPDDLKDQLALSERGLFSWLTGRGVLKEELLDRDAAALEAYYANRGFVDVKVGQPEIEYKEDGIYITFQVVEGKRYKVGEVQLRGDLIIDTQTLYEVIKTDDYAQEDKYFDRSLLRDDTQALADFYTNYGYAFAEATVDLSKHTKKQTIDVVFNLHKKQKVYIRRVTIAGNRKTRDNVIRRELQLVGGDQFSGKNLARSKQRLNKLDYFKSVDIETLPTEEPDEMDLKVKVEEKATGSFSAGAGFSSVNDVFFSGKVQERNLLGKGYNLSFRGTFGGTTTRFDLSFWNPHLWDGPLGLGFEAYNILNDFDEYDLDTKGGAAKFAYTIGDYTRLFWNYRIEQFEISDIAGDASEDILESEGDNLSSSLYISARRDTTNRLFNPSRGTENTLAFKYAGGVLGGDVNFFKTTYDFAFYHPLFWKFILSWRWRYGHLFKTTNKEIPDYERFYLGGIDTVRGYEYRDISAKDDEGRDIGGHKTFFTNLETIFPLFEEMGLNGVLFFDAGDVWGKDEEIDYDLFKSAGGGIRWRSPIGPLRIEYGIPLDDLKDNNGKLEFSVGQTF